MLNITKAGPSQTISSSPLCTAATKVEEVSNAPEYLQAKIQKLLEEKKRFLQDPVDPLSQDNLDEADPDYLLDEEYEIGRAEGGIWACSASYPALRAAALRRTTQEAIEEFHVEYENNCRQKVDILYQFEPREVEVYWAFRDKFCRLMEGCANRHYLPCEGDYPNAMFRSFEQGWTEAVRSFWHQIVPYVEGETSEHVGQD